MDREELIRDEPPPQPLDIVNGALRAVDGTFWLRPDRRFRADGRQVIDDERLEHLIGIALKVIPALGNADVMVALPAMRETRRLLDAIEHELVAIARSHHWSWRTLGEVLHVHASSVQRRFGREVVPPRKRRRDA